MQPCPSCGSENASDDVYCAKCGTKLLGTSAHESSDAKPGTPSTKYESQYAPIMLPAWLTLGMALVLLGALLILIGFMVFVVGTASLGSTTTLDSFKSYLEEFAALVGVGFFVAPIGWALHQASGRRKLG